MKKKELLSRTRRIKLVIFDVDGVLTNGMVYYGAREELVGFDVERGHLNEPNKTTN